MLGELLRAEALSGDAAAAPRQGGGPGPPPPPPPRPPPLLPRRTMAWCGQRVCDGHERLPVKGADTRTVLWARGGRSCAVLFRQGGAGLPARESSTAPRAAH